MSIYTNSESIILLGEVKHFVGDNGAEQQYQIVTPYEDYWVVTECGWIRYGPGSNLTYSHEYDPDYKPDFQYGENEYGFSLMNGFHAVYTNLTEFLEDCIVDESDLLIDGNDILVCPSWAIACLLDW